MNMHNGWMNVAKCIRCHIQYTTITAMVVKVWAVFPGMMISIIKMRQLWDRLIFIMGIPMQVHYNDVIMGAIASQITSLTIVYSTVYSGADQRKHESSASLAFVWEIHRGPVNSPQMASNAENVSIWWRHHEDGILILKLPLHCDVTDLAHHLCCWGPGVDLVPGTNRWAH